MLRLEVAVSKVQRCKVVFESQPPIISRCGEQVFHSSIYVPEGRRPSDGSPSVKARIMVTEFPDGMDSPKALLGLCKIL
jgi:hypothetical protein